MSFNKETLEILSGIEKRMKFINIMRSLVRVYYPDNIKKMIHGNSDILSNIIIAILAFIEEKTLGVKQSCSISDIEDFLNEFAERLPSDCEIDSEIMSRYIVTDVLQNGGKPMSYLTYNSATQKFEQTIIRLINEENGKYHLTNDAFDFMFRTKEIESELEYSVTIFRMREYMKRNNYAETLDTSRELIHRIRNMMNTMDDFIKFCKESISRIPIDKYEAIVRKTEILIDSEYAELEKIQKVAKEHRESMRTAVDSGVGTEELRKHFKALGEIIKNIQTALEEQRGLINRKRQVSESYEDILRESFILGSGHINFEKDIMTELKKSPYSPDITISKLLHMFSTPAFPKYFSIENFYAFQNKFDDTTKEKSIDISETDEIDDTYMKIRSQRYSDIIVLFIMYANYHDDFTVSDFVESLSVTQLKNLCEENALPEVLISLYAMQELNIEEWRNSEHISIMPNGEFELAWCMNEVDENLLQMKKIRFSSEKSEYVFTIKNNLQEKKYTLSNFRIEVIR